MNIPHFRAYLSAAAKGTLVAVCLQATIAAAATCAYVAGWINADSFVAWLQVSVGGACGAVVVGLPMGVVMLIVLERRHSRRNPPISFGRAPQTPAAEGTGAHPESAGHGTAPCAVAPHQGVPRHRLRHGGLYVVDPHHGHRYVQPDDEMSS